MIRKLTALTISLILFSSLPAFSQMAQIAFPSLLMSPQLGKIHSVKDLSKFMRKNFEFAEDIDNFRKTDYWQSPAEMLERKKGDCEDFALFADAVLQELGVESYVISIYGRNQYAHTVTVFKQDGKFRVINDGKLRKYDEETIEGALTRVHPEWTWAAFTERRNDRGWLKKIFYNPSFEPRSGSI